MEEIRFYPQRLSRNHNFFKWFCKEYNLNLSYMIKKQFMLTYILKIIKDSKIYTTGDFKCKICKEQINIYDKNADLDIVDIFDKREGISPEEIIPEKKSTAIVNFVCGNKKIPTVKDIEHITETLRKKKYKNISLGGTLMLDYPYYDYDEIRIGEGLLIGYSEVCKTRLLKSPFEIVCKVVKADEDTFLINEGILNFAGFTNYDVLSLSTDWTILKQNDKKLKKGDVVVLYPDYWTLLKLAHNHLLNNVVMETGE